MNDRIKKKLRDKGHTRPTEAASLMASKVEQHTEYTPADDQKNIADLRQMNERIYQIAQQYGSNTQERYNLLTAYDRIFDGTEEIEQKIKDGTYAKSGVISYESNS